MNRLVTRWPIGAQGFRCMVFTVFLAVSPFGALFLAGLLGLQEVGKSVGQSRRVLVGMNRLVTRWPIGAQASGKEPCWS